MHDLYIGNFWEMTELFLEATLFVSCHLCITQIDTTLYVGYHLCITQTDTTLYVSCHLLITQIVMTIVCGLVSLYRYNTD